MENRYTQRLVKSVVAWVVSSVATWLLMVCLSSIISALVEHKPIRISFGLDAMGWLIILATLIPTGLLGLPTQALLQRFRLTGFWSNLFAANLIGFPIGVLWVNFLWSLFDDDPEALEKSAFVQISEAVFDLGTKNPTPGTIVVFLLIAAPLFWLMRRPDLDHRSPKNSRIFNLLFKMIRVRACSHLA